MCYTNKLFQFKVLGPAWEVVREGQTFTHQVTDVHPRWAKLEELPEPVTVKIEPKLYTVVAGHTCPSEWGGWDGRPGFLTFYHRGDLHKIVKQDVRRLNEDRATHLPF